MKSLRQLTVVLAVAVAMVFAAAPALAGSIGATNGVQLRTTGEVANAADLTTTFTVPGSAVFVHVYANFTKGSLTNAIITPAGAMNGNAAEAGYYVNPDGAKTMTATGQFHYKMDAKAFAGSPYGALSVTSTGTTTSSNLLLYYKLERE